MKHPKITLNIAKGEQHGLYYVTSDAIPGLLAAGADIPAALEDAANGIRNLELARKSKPPAGVRKARK